MDPAPACRDTLASFARVFAPRDCTVETASTIARAKMVLFVITCQAPARARQDSRVEAAKTPATRVGLVWTAPSSAFAGMVQAVMALLASATVQLVSMATVVTVSAPVEGLG